MKKYRYLLVALYFSLGMLLQAGQNFHEEEKQHINIISRSLIQQKQAVETDNNSLSSTTSISFEFFIDLPDNNILHMVKFLHPNTIKCVKQTSVRLKNLLQFPDVWNFNLKQIDIKNANKAKQSYEKQKTLTDENERLIYRLYNKQERLLKEIQSYEKLREELSNSLMSSAVEFNSLKKIENENFYFAIVKNYDYFARKLHRTKRKLDIATRKNFHENLCQE